MEEGTQRWAACPHPKKTGLFPVSKSWTERSGRHSRISKPRLALPGTSVYQSQMADSYFEWYMQTWWLAGNNSKTSPVMKWNICHGGGFRLEEPLCNLAPVFRVTKVLDISKSRGAIHFRSMPDMKGESGNFHASYRNSMTWLANWHDSG